MNAEDLEDEQYAELGAKMFQAMMKSRRMCRRTFEVAVLEGWTREQTDHYIETGELPVADDKKPPIPENRTPEALQRENVRLRSYIYKYEQFRQQVAEVMAYCDKAALQDGNVRDALRKALDSMRQPAPQAPNSDIVNQVPELIGKHALVLYFKDDERRDAAALELKQALPDVQWKDYP